MQIFEEVPRSNFTFILHCMRGEAVPMHTFVGASKVPAPAPSAAFGIGCPIWHRPAHLPFSVLHPY